MAVLQPADPDKPGNTQAVISEIVNLRKKHSLRDGRSKA